MKTLLVFIALVITLTALSQSKVDSLLQLCEKVTDPEKTVLYLKLSRITIRDSALSNSYNNKAYQLALANEDITLQAKSVYLSGKICQTARNYTAAIRYYEKALPLYRQFNDTLSMITCYSYIGIANFHLSKSKEAIAGYIEGLKLSTNDPDYSAELLANIGLVHDEINHFSEAIAYFRKALKINQTIGDTVSMAIDYDYLGASYARLKMPDSALVNYHRALYLFKTIGKEDRYAVSLSNTASVFCNYPDSLTKALTYFNMAWNKFQELGWEHYEAEIQQGIANVLSKQGKYDQAISTFQKSIQLAHLYKRELLLKKTIYKDMAETYQKKGDYQLAMETHILYSLYTDSVTETERFEQIGHLEKQYETEKKEHEILHLQARQDLTDIQLRKNKQLKLLGYVTALLLLLFILFILKKYFDKIKLNQLLEEKNRKIELSEQELRLLNASMNKFFSIIAHDLKNPLHTVMGFSHLLTNNYEQFSEIERRKFATDIYKSTNNIFRLLENLLQWSKSQTGRLNFSPVETELARLLENSASVLRPMAEQKKIQMTFNCCEDLKVYADPLMIETVLRNLINNAIKFTPDNGSIGIAVERVENKVRINVSDTGVGISEEDIQNLFQIDSKVKRKGTNNEDGSGLGLILCNEFVSKNNGRLWVESVQGKGSSFNFTVPAFASSI